VTEEMYDTVGAALLWTLGQGLGAAFTSEVEAAWAETYNTLADVMKSAAYAHV
jgi:hemoglobin-like flavoprotein